MPIYQYFRCFLVTSCFFLFLFPTVINASFNDDFNNIDSLDNYTVSQNGGSVNVVDGAMALQAPTTANQFPYIRLKPELLVEPITEVEIRFKYSNIGKFGAGIVVDDFFPANGTNYDVGSNSIVWTWNWESPPTVKLGRYSFVYSIIPGQTDWHTLRLSGIPGDYSVYLDEIFQGTTATSKSIKAIWFGNPDVVSTADTWPDIYIDYLSIIDNSALFPYYSQLDPLWKNVMYDNANEWASDGSQGIGNWGCAITSVAMMLSKYGIRMPDGTEATPLAINAWLKSQDDGYIGSGLLNWLAVSRLVRQSRTAGQADTDLEFVKSSGSAGDELTAGYYPILNTGGHFVIAYDHDSTNYLINDPLLSGEQSIAKSSTIASINTYIPSDTDLSYILISIPTDVEVALKQGGNSVGSSYSEYITDDITAGVSPTTKLIYLPSPVIGNYEISFDSPTEAAVEIIGYDLDGNAQIVKQNIPEGSSHYNYIYSHTTAPVLTAVDTDPPTYTGTNSFEGWYNSVQTATFNYTDDNLPDNFVPPSCRISTEGKNQVCQVRATVCDRYNNCRTDELTSNPANIDLTPPKPPITSWVLPWRPYSYVFWPQTKDSIKYIIRWGEQKNNLTNEKSVSHPYSWIYTPKMQSYYFALQSVDRAGNVSNESRVMSVRPRLWSYFWR